MAEERLPPVVAVVVAANPLEVFEECLVSLVTQDYANLSVIVVDSASEPPLAERVAAVAPELYLHRLEENAGFATAANVVLSSVEGAAHYLFCHDDVVLEPDVVRRLVEDAFRHNAGIVSPKLVDHDEPDRILQLGLGVDRFGAPVRRVERREFDQAQHDDTREVFAAPGGCTLVRSDLFAAIGGFDEAIFAFNEDVDLCWRARLAGARVVVSPRATVRHLEASASGRRPLGAARALQWRHELRCVLKNYGKVRRSTTVVQLSVLSLIECAYFFVLGERDRVRQVLDAWRWNLSSQSGLKDARRRAMDLRRVPEREVVKLLTSRTSRLWRFLHRLGDDFLVSLNKRRGWRARPALGKERTLWSRNEIVLGVLLGLVCLFGSRDLIVGHLPVVGSFSAPPSAVHLFREYFGGTRDAGTQNPGPASPALLLLGIADILALSSTGLVLKLCIALSVVLGTYGMARLLRGFGPPLVRLAGASAYVFLPLCFDDLGRGDLAGLVAFAGAPFVITRLGRATRAAPFVPTRTSDATPKGSARRELFGEALGLGVVLALVGAFVPLCVLLAPMVALAFVLSSALAGGTKGALRSLVVALSGTIVALAVLFPWSLTFFQAHSDWSAIFGAAGPLGQAPTLGSLLGLDLGTIGKGALSFFFVLSGLFALSVGRGLRFRWSVHAYGVVFVAAALSLALSRGWLVHRGSELSVLLAPLAVGVALLVGLGVATFQDDLRQEHFGWRHLAAFLFGALFLVGLVPVAGASLSGRWGLPGAGYEAVLSWANGEPGMTVYLGDPRAIPLASWQQGPGVGLGVAPSGVANGTRFWPSANPGTARLMMADVSEAESGRTVRLGHLLAPLGVHYLVVPTGLAPVLGGSAVPSFPPPEALLSGLSAQADLHELPSDAGTLVFENAAFSSVSPKLSGATTPSWLRALSVAGQIVGFCLFATYYLRRRRRRKETPGDEPGNAETDEHENLDLELAGIGAAGSS